MAMILWKADFDNFLNELKFISLSFRTQVLKYFLFQKIGSEAQKT